MLAPRVGFEPTTLRLTAECSTIELPRNDVAQALSLEQTPLSAVNFDSVPFAKSCGLPYAEAILRSRMVSRLLYRAAVFFLMMPHFAARSIKE